MTAPTSPLTYERAVAAAEALVAARNAPADPVATVAAMSQQIATIREKTASWAKTAIHGLWAMVDPYDAKSVQAFTEQAAALIESAQTAAVRVAGAAQAQQLVAAGINAIAAPSNPIDVRGAAAVIKKGQLVLVRHAVSVDYASADVKVSKGDMTTRGIFERPSAVYRYAKSQGATDAEANALAGNRIDGLVNDNLMLASRLAQHQVIVGAVVDLDTGRTRNGTKIIGYRRVIHPELSIGGTCGMCIAASDRIYNVAQLLPIHNKCHCTIAAITEDYDPADDLNAVDLHQLYKQAGGTSVAHLKRTRYKEDQHGELGAVLAPAAKYKPRTTKSKVRVGGTALLEDQPAQAEVAKHQIGVLEKNLAKMRDEGVPEDSSKIAYHNGLIEKLKKQVEADASTGGDKPPGKPPTGGQSVQGDDDPRRYPKVGGKGGSVPFTPDNPPEVTDERLDHILDGKPKKSGWDGGHAFGSGRGKSEFPEGWDRPKIKAAIEQVLRAPDAINREGSTLTFSGKVDGQAMEVRVRGRSQGPPKLWTAYPVNT